jgi:hypothetical protein
MHYFNDRVRKVPNITTAPVWNEALSFNVPAELLPKVTLEVAILDHDLIVGKCTIGSSREGNEGKHWNEMMLNHHKSMAMWIPNALLQR